MGHVTVRLQVSDLNQLPDYTVRFITLQPDKLGPNTTFYAPITFEEIVIAMINPQNILENTKRCNNELRNELSNLPTLVTSCSTQTVYQVTNDVAEKFALKFLS